MLYYLATACGFIDCDGYFTANIRHAKPFESFEAADAYAKGNNYLARSYYAILSNGED